MVEGGGGNDDDDDRDDGVEEGKERGFDKGRMNDDDIRMRYIMVCMCGSRSGGV
eukprot:CAMPEP_0182456460 /NCGR_PEP_ID=MMETSP1319-20130603/2285_1 /TAXON_ID=172717 /ORGANISM="Bolidomonas pacifica, Strain RCC208" /LENGTH=53 /DNA_ID=CAMNT_0024654705 /DNA_START=498 /DNA_END=659 /DNA_ORIENTATION=-